MVHVELQSITYISYLKMIVRTSNYHNLWMVHDAWMLVWFIV